MKVDNCHLSPMLLVSTILINQCDSALCQDLINILHALYFLYFQLQSRIILTSASLMQVIIVTSSLMKDMNSKTDLYRANAIRVLCRITDGGLLGQIERYLKQAVVDKNPVVSSAALVSGIHLLQVVCLRDTEFRELNNGFGL